MMENFSVPPLWVELVAGIWFMLIFMGIPLGIAIFIDKNKTAGIFLIVISAIAWIVLIFKLIKE